MRGSERKQVLLFVCEEGMRDRLVRLIRSISDKFLIRLADDFSEAYRVILEYKIDTLVCCAEREHGKRTPCSVYHFIEVVRTVQRYYFTPIILVSNVEDPSNYCFRELHCFDVIEYPFRAERFIHSLQKALCYTAYGEDEHMLYIQEEHVLYPVLCSQISHIQSMNHVMEVHLIDGSCRTLRYCTMKQLLETADVSFLLQCSRSAIINLDYVYCVDYVNRLVTMQSKRQLPIGSTYVKTLQEYFKKLQTR